MNIVRKGIRETSRQYALRMIKESIINLDLEPGRIVSESELASQMGLSRTPVREALMDLAKVKIVEIYPQKGSCIPLIDEKLVEESRFMRYVLECSVVEQVCKMVTEESLAELQENLKLQKFYLEISSVEKLLELDNFFHEILFEIAEKSLVYTMMSNLSIHFDRVRKMSMTTIKEIKIVEDHAEIVKSIEERDPVRARAAMERHLNRYKFDPESIHEKYPNYFIKR